MASNESGQRYRYDVFISYARDPDYRLARELTRFLETFHRTRIPSDSPEDQRPRLRPLKVCLDGVTFSLPSAGKGSHEVSEVIERYLGESTELLVLCSENTRLSSGAYAAIGESPRKRADYRPRAGISRRLLEGRRSAYGKQRRRSLHTTDHRSWRERCRSTRGGLPLR